MKVVIYCRTSTLDQNPENQRIELEKYARAMGYDYTIFEEQESTKKTRPVKQIVLQKLRRKEYDALMIWKLDRWGRSIIELITDLKELTDKGIKILSLKENIDYTTSSGQLFANMLSAFAEYERSIIKERTILGLDRIKKEIKDKGFYITKEGKKITERGRPKGSTDKKKRRISGYTQRWTKKTPP